MGSRRCWRDTGLNEHVGGEGEAVTGRSIDSIRSKEGFVMFYITD